MANNTQDVELRIRASNYSKKTTDEVVDALKKMVGAQDAQIESAKKGTTTIQQLEKSYTQLESAAKALLGQNSLVNLFQSQGQALTELQVKLDAARKAQQDFQAAAAAGAKAQGMSYNEFKSKNLADFTKAEGSHAAAMARISKEWTEYKASLDAGSQSQAQSATEAKKLASAVAAAEKELARMQGRVETTKAKLGEFGIDTANVAAAQQKIVAAVTTANDALARQEAAIDSHDGHAAQRRAAAEAAAAATQQAAASAKVADAARQAAAALDAERRAQQEANEVARMNQAAKQAEADIIFSNAEREAAEAINRKTAAIRQQQLAMQAAANAAEQGTRNALVTARGQTPVSQPNLAGQIRDIQNPADAAVRTVGGLESAIAGLETRVSAIRGPVKDYKGAVEEATRAQKALTQIAGQVDAYDRQMASLRAARAEFGQARLAVNRLVAEMRSGNAGDDITTRLNAAQRTMQAAAQRLGDLTTAARAQRDALRGAGIDTQNLSSAEQQLVGQAQRATTALNTLNRAYQQHGAAADNAGSRMFNWFGGNGGRTTLSYMQRMRGELLGLAAGFVGLNAAIQVGKSALTAYNDNQAIMSRLTIANGGDSRKAAEDFKYLQAQADRIGFVFQKIAPAYTKFAIAAQSAGFTTQQTRFSFENIAGAAVKAKLSTEELEGVMKAFEQMMSKGTIQAEELRGQLGDRLPGAFTIAARAANMTVQDFTKAMSEGKIGSEQVIAIARELGKTYGAAQTGTETLLVAQARFENATNRFLTDTAQGGFVQAYQGLLNKLTTMLNDGTAAKFANALGQALTAVVDVLRFCADHVDGLKLAFELLIGVKVILWLIRLPGLFKALQAEILIANGAMMAFQGWLDRQAAAAALARALGATGLTGVVARLTPVLVGATGALMGLARAIPYIGLAVAAAEGINFAIDKYDESTVEGMVATVNNGTNSIKEAYAAREAYDRARGTAEEAALKAEYDRKRDIMQKGTFAVQNAIQAARKKGFFDKGAGMMNKDEVKSALKDFYAASDAVPAQAQPTADPGDPSNAESIMRTLKQKLGVEDAKNERQFRLARLKAEKGDLAERIEIIREPFEEYKKQYAMNIKDADERAKAVALIDKSAAQAEKLERQKYANEQARNGESAAKKRITLIEQISTRLKDAEADIANRQSKQDTDLPYIDRENARVAAVSKAYDELNKDMAKLRPLDPKQAAEFDVRLNKIKKEREEVERVNSKRDEANRLLDEYNQKQGILNNKLAAIKTEEDTGKISHTEALDQANKQISDLGPGIEAAGKKALEFAVKFSDQLDPTRFAEIASTISQGMAKNGKDSQIAINMMNTAQTQLNEALAQQEREIDAINLKRQLGAIDSVQQVDAINAITAKYAGSIQMLAQNLIGFIATVKAKGGMSPEQLAVMDAAAQKVLATSQAGIVKAQEWETTLVQSIAQNGSNAFDQMAESIGKVITGQQGIGEGFRGMLSAAGMFFASLMKDLAMAIIRMQILKMLQGFGGGIGAAATSMLGAGVAHSGAVIGSSGGRSRSNVSAAAFIGATRYHTGGIAGLAPNEVPTVLEKGEEVLTRGDPRHILNMGSQVSNLASAQATPQRFVLVDDRSQVPQAMASSEGEKVTMVHLKNNLPTLKQWMKGR
jgi:tape measure domain-containing protein